MDIADTLIDKISDLFGAKTIRKEHRIKYLQGITSKWTGRSKDIMHEIFPFINGMTFSEVQQAGGALLKTHERGDKKDDIGEH